MKPERLILTAALLCISSCPVFSQQAEAEGNVRIARVRYFGGGDWYNDRSALPNLARFIKENTLIDISLQETVVTLTDETLFAFPVIFMTGHGRISLSDSEAASLREYLEKGGFLYADDDYGMDSSFREAMRKVFPGRQLQELPFSHGIYKAHFTFSGGLPKIHEHDNNPPRGFGIINDRGRLLVFYTWETNLSDGWADPEVHKDPAEKRLEALRMGTNIIVWALRQ